MQGCRVSAGLLYYIQIFVLYKIFRRPSLQRLEEGDASTRVPTTVRGLVFPAKRDPEQGALPRERSVLEAMSQVTL